MIASPRPGRRFWAGLLLMLLAGFFLVLGLFATVILLEVDWLLYPMSLLTMAGEIVLLAILGVVIASAVLQRDRQATSAWDLPPLIVAGLGLTALLLGVMSAMRYAVLGSTTLLP